MDHPTMAAILTAPEKDPVLEAEASTYGAVCVLTPTTSAELLSLVSSALGSRSV
jgi:hypothetical protein